MKKLGPGELEARIMDVLWDRAGWLTPRDVQDAITRRRPLAYTTVMTILVRLWGKGLLDRRHEGRAFAYRPVMSRDEWAAQRMTEILDAVDDPRAALSRFVEAIGPAETRELRRILGKRRAP